MKNNMQGQALLDKGMDEQKKAKLIKTYKGYQVVDWIIAIVIIGAPILVGMLEGVGLPGFSVNGMMQFIGNLPATVIVPIAVLSTAYTIWSMVLYVKVWPIKEIPKGFDYWFDWILTIVLTAYEFFIFYVILFR